MKLIVLLGVMVGLSGSVGCATDYQDDGDGNFCSSQLQVKAAIPRREAMGIALDAHPSVFLEAGDEGCLVTPPDSVPESLTLTLQNHQVDGTVESHIEGQSAVVSFIPAAPLLPKSYYTLSFGNLSSSFTTGTTLETAPPGPATVVGIVAARESPTYQTLTVTVDAGYDTQEWVHLILTDATGAPISPVFRPKLGFVLAASQPKAEAEGKLGYDADRQICFVAQSENLSGLLSATSDPVCALAR